MNKWDYIVGEYISARDLLILGLFMAFVITSLMLRKSKSRVRR